MTTIAYTNEPSEDDLERIGEVICNRDSAEMFGVNVLDLYQINAANHVLSGTIMVGEVEHGFIVEMGDIQGCQVHAWGDPENTGRYQPPKPNLRTFIPKDLWLLAKNPAMFEVYCLWRDEPWFKELEQKYNYDRLFQPGGKIEDHYRAKAAERGLVPGYMDELPAEQRRLIVMAKAERRTCILALIAEQKAVPHG